MHGAKPHTCDSAAPAAFRRRGAATPEHVMPAAPDTSSQHPPGPTATAPSSSPSQHKTWRRAGLTCTVPVQVAGVYAIDGEGGRQSS